MDLRNFSRFAEYNVVGKNSELSKASWNEAQWKSKKRRLQTSQNVQQQARKWMEQNQWLRPVKARLKLVTASQRAMPNTSFTNPERLATCRLV